VHVLVTGAAGFIGSHIADALLAQGHAVLGVDCFVEHYPRRQKDLNLQRLVGRAGFDFIEADLSEAPPERLQAWLTDCPFVCHQAAQAGVRTSWGPQFDACVRHNVLTTQRLLEAARSARVQRFVYASSSSVYGSAADLPLREDAPTHPASPYGVTKLAGEHLASLYWTNWQVPTVILRYFTVYGPGQRPDMAFHRLLRSVLCGESFLVYGDGSQTRSFTFVEDVVRANLAALFRHDNAAATAYLGQPINIGGGERRALSEVIELAEQVTGQAVSRQAAADLTRARAWLGYEPSTGLRDGLAAEWNWLRALYA